MLKSITCNSNGVLNDFISEDINLIETMPEYYTYIPRPNQNIVWNHFFPYKNTGQTFIEASTPIFITQNSKLHLLGVASIQISTDDLLKNDENTMEKFEKKQQNSRKSCQNQNKNYLSVCQMDSLRLIKCFSENQCENP